MKAILLAAGVGKRFGNRTKKLPKCLIPLGNTDSTLLSRYLHAYRCCGITDVIIVVGHESQKIKKACARNGDGLSIRFIENPSYRKGSLYSLFKASAQMNDDCLIMDADVYFSPAQLLKLVRSRKKTAFLIDTRSKSTGEEMMLMAHRKKAVHIAKKINPSLGILGEATGILKISKKDARTLASILKNHVKRRNVLAEYEESYCDLMKKSKVGYETIRGFWTEMDFEEDLKKIRQHNSR